MATMNFNFRDAMDVVEAMGEKQAWADMISAKCALLPNGKFELPSTSWQDTKDKVIGAFFDQAMSVENAEFEANTLANWYQRGYQLGVERASR